MLINTSVLEGAALDWAMAQCVWERGRIFLFGVPTKHVRILNQPGLDHSYQFSFEYSPSTNWLQGGPIIERERLVIGPHPAQGWVARCFCDLREFDGPSPLIAAMRCYVASTLGEKIDVPKELCK